MPTVHLMICSIWSDNYLNSVDIYRGSTYQAPPLLLV